MRPDLHIQKLMGWSSYAPPLSLSLFLSLSLSVCPQCSLTGCHQGHICKKKVLWLNVYPLGDGRRRGQQRKYFMDNVWEWTSLSTQELLTLASRRQYWKRISAESSITFPHPFPPPPGNPVGQGTELTWYEQPRKPISEWKTKRIVGSQVKVSVCLSPVFTYWMSSGTYL